MKSRCFASTLAAALAACGGPAQGSFPQTAMPPAMGMSLASDHSTRESVTYNVLELPTLGGTQAFANWINDDGWVAGAADLAGGRDEHAFIWHGNEIHDLGTLGGKNSLAWPVNDRGTVAGDSDTSTNDPLMENFCHFVIDGRAQFTKHTCSGYVLIDGAMTALPTLGGNNGSVFGMNSRGEIVGVAENTTQDQGCIAPQVLDFEAVIWAPKSRQIQKLPPLKGDVIGGAIAINDRGDVVGGSGMCAPVSPTIGAHAILWHKGRPRNLGGFGGQTSNLAFDINDRGHIVGFSDLSGDNVTHAFFWKNGKMTDLGTLPGDVFSFGFGINELDQVVGESCDASFNCRAFIWQNGVMTDLNSLVRDSTLPLMLAESINKDGEITGIAYDAMTGGVPAYVATPTHGHVSGLVPSRIILPESIRVRLEQMRARL